MTITEIKILVFWFQMWIRLARGISESGNSLDNEMIKPDVQRKKKIE